jgi:hypothetical protein
MFATGPGCSPAITANELFTDRARSQRAGMPLHARLCQGALQFQPSGSKEVGLRRDPLPGGPKKNFMTCRKVLS